MPEHDRDPRSFRCNEIPTVDPVPFSELEIGERFTWWGDREENVNKKTSDRYCQSRFNALGPIAALEKVIRVP